MARDVSVRELRNHTAQVVAAVRAGERLSLTVNRTRVADIVPHADAASPWIASSTLLQIIEDAAADPGLLVDLSDVRQAEIDGA